MDEKTLVKISGSAGIAGLGNIAGLVFGYLTTLLITRSLGPELYGMYVLASTLIGIGVIVSRVGLDNGLLRFVALYRAQGDPHRITGSILFATQVVLPCSLVLAAALYVLSPVLSKEIFDEPELSNILRLLLVTLPFLSVQTLFLAAIQAFQRIPLRVYVDKLLKPAAKIASLVILLLLGMRLGAVIASSVIAAAFACFMSLYFLMRTFPIRSKETRAVSERKELTKFSVPLMFDGLLVFMIEWIDILMIGYFLYASHVGIYGAVVKVSALGLFVLHAFNMIFAPMISEYYAFRKMEDLAELFKMITKWIFTISFPLFLIMILLANPIMSIFGAGFTLGASCLVILSLARIIDSAVGACGGVILMTGRSKINLLNSAFLALLSVGLNYLFIPRYGIVGAAAATGISIAAINLLRLVEVYFILGIHPYQWSFLKPLGSGLAALAVTSFLMKHMTLSGPWLIVLAGLFFGCLYVGLLFAMRLEEEDTIVLRKIRQKLFVSSPGLSKQC
jgi:O-antigen/teichoic acid export membrane protein